MGDEANQAPGLTMLGRRIARTGLGILRNRAELLTVEWQEEKARLVQLLVWSLALLFLALMTVCLFTAAVILLVPADYRIWVTAGFAVIYAGGAAWAFFALKGLVKKKPFCESIEQVRKDISWMEKAE